jgi:hypothetical protein
LSARDQTDRTDLNQLRVASRPGSGLQNRSNGSHTLLRDVGKQEFGEFAWMGERNQVATWDFVNGLAEPLVCHARLKVTRKEPIVFTNYHVNRNVGPRLEVRGLAEGDLGFLALVRGAFFGDILWHIMEEIRCEIELDAVATPLGRSLPRFEPPSVIPPLTGRFAGKRDHRVHEVEHANRRPSASADERCCECAHRLGNECHVVSLPDRGDDEVGVGV